MVSLLLRTSHGVSDGDASTKYFSPHTISPHQNKERKAKKAEIVPFCCPYLVVFPRSQKRIEERGLCPSSSVFRQE